ncbi:competence protein ComK [Cytobacillus sp. NCCP-133]|uniref:competence protein ComK n=1 Tax=Cytobacillus sp. NCCP-133 TaxID=766848 RepID=UPI00222FB36E|nr:competence protein ComK [Cytobacillus sp. NCCP-133]GLB59510.1 hypothetical protein NCCP133_16430 [Cytobacillus sp. NCCP-133]
MVVSINEKFVIRRNTMAILPGSSSRGSYSKIMEVGQTFSLELPPFEVMNDSLLHYCSDLKGSIRGTKAILGSTSTPPVCINANLDMYWFPHKSPFMPDCVWIALHHVKDLRFESNSQTSLFFSNGQSIYLDIGIRHIQSIIDLAEELRYKMIKTRNRTRSFTFDSKNGLQLVSEESNKYK